MKKIVSVYLILGMLASACDSGGDEDGTDTNPDSPVMNVIGNKTVNSGDTLGFFVQAEDPNGLQLIYATDGAVGDNLNPYSETASLALFDPESREFSWDTTGVALGNYYVEFSVMNTASQEDSEIVRISVQDAQLEFGRELYNTHCFGSGCHRNEDDNGSGGGVFGILCSETITIKTATESGPGNMPVIDLTDAEEAAISYYLKNVRPEDCVVN